MQQIYIVTPVFNAVNTISQTIASIATQTGDFELFYHIQDGGSTDGTIDKIIAWEKQIESLSSLFNNTIHFSWESTADAGMYDAINKAFARFTMPDNALMGWCNADDSMWQGALQSITSVYSDLPNLEWITGWRSLSDHAGRIHVDTDYHNSVQFVKNGLADCHHQIVLQQESTFWKTSLWNKVNGLDPSFKLAGDWDLWRRFAKHAELYHVQRQLGTFYQREGQQSQDMKAYEAEMEATIPFIAREKMALTLLKNPQKNLETFSIWYDIGVKKWRVFQHTPTKKRKLLAFLAKFYFVEKIKRRFWRVNFQVHYVESI